MAAVYDEVEIEDMEWHAARATFTYTCPCGDLFAITLAELLEGEDIARCPSCSLRIRVVCELETLEATYGAAAAAAAATEPTATEVAAA